MQIIVDGLLVNYIRSGKGKVVILLHGWANTSKDLANIQSKLSKKFDVITPDLPGFGGSARPKADWDLNNYRDFIVSFLNKLDIDSVYAVIGHSNGGAVGIKLAASSKVKIDKLILIASSGIRLPGSKLRLIKTKLGKAVISPLPKQTKDKLRSKYYTKIGSDMLLVPEMAGTFKKVVSEDVSEEAGKIDIPTLLIYGENDTETPVDYGMMFHQKINGSTLEVIPGTGHFVHKDEEQKVLKLIEGFIC